VSLCRKQKSEPELPGFLVQPRDSFGREMGPGCREELRIDYLDDLWGGVSTSPSVAKPSRPQFIFCWPVSMKLKRLSDHRNTSVFVPRVKQF
jgi:hypothetical protein